MNGKEEAVPKLGGQVAVHYYREIVDAHSEYRVVFDDPKRELH